MGYAELARILYDISVTENLSARGHPSPHAWRPAGLCPALTMLTRQAASAPVCMCVCVYGCFCVQRCVYVCSCAQFVLGGYVFLFVCMCAACVGRGEGGRECEEKRTCAFLRECETKCERALATAHRSKRRYRALAMSLV